MVGGIAEDDVPDMGDDVATLKELPMLCRGVRELDPVRAAVEAVHALICFHSYREPPPRARL